VNRVCTPSSPVRERGRERERKREGDRGRQRETEGDRGRQRETEGDRGRQRETEGERDVEYVFQLSRIVIFLKKRMTGALTPFSYLVFNMELS
jgi:hypothetical protein